MTGQEKQILLQDLCARLPYGVMVHYRSNNPIFYTNNFSLNEKLLLEFRTPDCGVELKPYLRPISSMTEEEQKEFVEFHCVNLCRIIIDDMLTLKNEINMFDWLNAHHFDYRGLISKGLALEDTEKMYNTKIE